jgi:hypothetical protein
MESGIQFSIDDMIIENKEEDDNLDISWIQEHERIQNIQKSYCREPMTSIPLFFIYINQHQYIDKILSEKHDISVEDKLSKEALLHIVEKHKISTPVSKYKLVDVLKFHVTIEPEHIQTFSKNENIEEISKDLMKVLPVLDEIKIEPSIFIFHSLNSIYFIFQEVLKPTGDHRHTIKSILKAGGSAGGGGSSGLHKATKKVRIDLPNEKRESGKKSTPTFVTSNRKTRKNLILSSSS